MKFNSSRLLVGVGLLLMLIGAIDPLEGSVVILGGSALAAIGAFLDRTHRFRLQVAALVLTAVGVGALFALSAVGGVGGNTGRSLWWLLVCVPYPVGWLMSLAGAVKKLRQPASAAA